jgi:hypothetical protein
LNVDFVQFLLERGALPDYDGPSALLRLLDQLFDPVKTTEIMRLLIHNRANVYAPFPHHPRGLSIKEYFEQEADDNFKEAFRSAFSTYQFDFSG